jgi:hypothetical protein
MDSIFNMYSLPFNKVRVIELRLLGLEGHIDQDPTARNTYRLEAIIFTRFVVIVMTGLNMNICTMF